MNCKTCNYALWKNTTGKCPECGTPFKPSDFEFVPGSVRFCCPHCSQQYFGTDSRGQLEPRAFTCVKCLRPIDIDQMVLMPEHGVSEAATARDTLPLTDESLGFFKRWWRTVSWALIGPHRLGSSINPAQGTGSAWLFACLTNLLVTLCSFGVFLIIIPFGMLMVPKGTPPLPIGGMALGIGGSALGIGLIAYPIYIALWGLFAHLIMNIGSQKTAYSLRHTYATLCLSSGANAVNMIPCLGMYSIVGTIWWIVSATISFRYAQRVSGVKAACAAIIPPLLAFSTCFGIYAGFMFFIVSKAASMSATRSAMAYPDDFLKTHALTTALTTEITVNGQWPAHISKLVFDRSLSTIDFTLSRSGTTDDTIKLGGTTLANVILLPKSEERRLAAAFAAATPPPVYRFGDFVFTYQGVPITNQNAQPGWADLWIVISSADPNSPPPPLVANPFGGSVPAPQTSVPPTPRSICIGTVSGKSKPIDPTQFQTELAKQNAVRATFGLSPIPSPETVPQWNLPQPNSSNSPN